MCCSPWGREELDRTGRLNNSNFQGTLTNTGMLFCSLSKLRTIYTGPFLPLLFLPTFYHPQPPLSPAQGGSLFVSVSSVSGKPSSYRTCFIHFSCSASFFCFCKPSFLQYESQDGLLLFLPLFSFLSLHLSLKAINKHRMPSCLFGVESCTKTLKEDNTG